MIAGVPVPDIRYDYDPTDGSYTARTPFDSDNVIFKLVPNEQLGLDFFGAFGSVGIWQAFAKDTAYPLHNAIGSTFTRNLTPLFFRTAQVRSPLYGGIPFQLLAVLVNQVNILGSPLTVDSDLWLDLPIITDIEVPANSRWLAQTELGFFDEFEIRIT